MLKFRYNYRDYKYIRYNRMKILSPAVSTNKVKRESLENLIFPWRTAPLSKLSFFESVRSSIASGLIYGAFYIVMFSPEEVSKYFASQFPSGVEHALKATIKAIFEKYQHPTSHSDSLTKISPADLFKPDLSVILDKKLNAFYNDANSSIADGAYKVNNTLPPTPLIIDTLLHVNIDRFLPGELRVDGDKAIRVYKI